MQKNTIVFEFGKLTTSRIVVSNHKKRSLVTNLFYDGHNSIKLENVSNLIATRGISRLQTWR